MKIKKTEVSVVMPAYNEGGTISKVINSVGNAMKKIGISYNIIVVDDGSKDKTASEVKKTNAILVQHPYNKGYGAALKTGTKAANSEYILFIDSDGQNNPNDIAKLLKEREKYDMIVGARPQDKIYKAFRGVGRKILNLVANFLAERKIPDLNSGFRLVRRETVLEFMHILPNTFSFTTTITLSCLKSGHNVKYVPIDFRPRTAGKSTMKHFKDGIRFIIFLLRITTLFSPLRVFLPISIGLLLAGFVALLFFIIAQAHISQTALMTILFGLLVFFFGLLADQNAIIARRKPEN